MAWNMLVVDDDAPVLYTLKDVFETRGFSVSVASSAAEAVRRLAEMRFDLVVTDMRMETHTSGYEVVRAAKQQPHRPIAVILSAFPIPASDWRDSGADAMFMKGSPIDRMLDDIERLANSRKREQEKTSPRPERADKVG